MTALVYVCQWCRKAILPPSTPVMLKAANGSERAYHPGCAADIKQTRKHARKHPLPVTFE